MSEVLNLQESEPDTPSEEKGSWVSLALCHNSRKSIAACWVR